METAPDVEAVQSMKKKWLWLDASPAPQPQN